MSDEEVSVEMLLVLPHNQYRFKYRINDGSFHYINKNDTTSFLSRYISEKNIATLREMLVTLQPFVILPSEDLIIHLRKIDEESTLDGSLSNLSEKEMEKIYQMLQQGDFSERVTNDKLLGELQDRNIKKDAEPRFTL